MSQAGSTGNNPSLASGGRLVGNSIWNLLGLGLPALLALATIPLLIDALGTERFGVLTLAWMMVGYFSLFDMGLGRAMTQMIARQLGRGDHGSIPGTFWTGLMLMTTVGLLVAAVLMLIAPWLVDSVMKVSTDLAGEVRWGIYLVALGLPLVVSSSGLQGMIEAHQRFKVIFAGKMLQGTVTYLGPLIAVQFTTHLAAAIGILLCGRIASWLMFLAIDLRMLPEEKRRFHFDASLIRPMITFGGWMTVSNIMAPLLVYADRLMVGGMVLMGSVAYYTTPAEIIVKLLILPNALLGVVFPVLAGTYQHDPERTARLYDRSIRYLFLMMMPISLIGIGFAPMLLGLWLGHEFSVHSYRVLQWMMIGIFFNGLAHMPSGLISAVGRPDLTVKLQAIEVPFYLGVLWLLVSQMGIEGAAIAWMLRTALDAVLLSLGSSFLVKSISRNLWNMLAAGMISMVCLSLLVLADLSPVTRAWVSLGMLSVFVALGWTVLLQTNERRKLLDMLKPSRWRIRTGTME